MASGRWSRGLRNAAVLAGALALAACTVDPPSATTVAVDEVVDPDATVRIAMITHGDAGGFWTVIRRGAQDAAAAQNVTLDYQGSAGDARLQSQMIQAALVAGAQALAVSAPDIGAIRASLQQAINQGVPVVTLNSGAELAESEPGVITHVGQSEFIAGQGAGEKLAEAGATNVLCIVHEQNNIGLQERCAGAADGLATKGATSRNVQVTGKADPASTGREIGAAIAAQQPDAVLTLDPDIAMAANQAAAAAGVLLATFDLSPDVLSAIANGTIVFAVDQQPYLQGYLPIVFLQLAVRNGNEVDAGDIVLTGPSFVTAENVSRIAALSERGTR